MSGKCAWVCDHLTVFSLVFTSGLLGATFAMTTAFEIDIQTRTTFVPRALPSAAGILTTANLKTGKSPCY